MEGTEGVVLDHVHGCFLGVLAFEGCGKGLDSKAWAVGGTGKGLLGGLQLSGDGWAGAGEVCGGGDGGGGVGDVQEGFLPGAPNGCVVSGGHVGDVEACFAAGQGEEWVAPGESGLEDGLPGRNDMIVPLCSHGVGNEVIACHVLCRRGCVVPQECGGDLFCEAVWLEFHQSLCQCRQSVGRDLEGLGRVGEVYVCVVTVTR